MIHYFFFHYRKSGLRIYRAEQTHGGEDIALVEKYLGVLGAQGVHIVLGVHGLGKYILIIRRGYYDAACADDIFYRAQVLALLHETLAQRRVYRGDKAAVTLYADA